MEYNLAQIAKVRQCISRFKAVWLILTVLILEVGKVAGNLLLITTQPQSTSAGEAFPIQPALKVTDDNGVLLSSLNTGTVIVSIGNNPSGFASVRGTTTEFSIANGLVQCSGLYINEVGTGYTLTFISLSHGIQVTSVAFDISIGAPYKLSIVTNPGTATGGLPFQPQPVLAVQDKGGNTVTSQNSGQVTVSLSSNPSAGNLTPSSAFTVTFSVGLAIFQLLEIDKEGSPYVLTFTTDLNLDGAKTVSTFPFTVGIGPALSLEVSNPPDGATGGKAFASQPVVKVKDAGGNLLVSDSESKIKVSIHNNPSGGTLSPATEHMVQLANGEAIFRNLRIDKIGSAYSLIFSLYDKVSGVSKWVKNGLTVESTAFNVVLGSPSKLVVTRIPSGAVADGQPIPQQPRLELQDAGGNVVKTESASKVTSTLVSSVSVTSEIVIDTTAAGSTTVESVTSVTPLTSGPYGVGMEIIIVVKFTQEVTASGSPVLLLETGSIDRQATCTSTNKRSKEQLFKYTVQAGDASSDLDYVSDTSLDLNGGSIVDGNSANADLKLPAVGSASSLSGTSSIAIDTSTPTITDVRSTTPGDGEYGVGQEIEIIVTFSAPVSVTGSPTLSIPVGNTQTAVYKSGSDTTQLVFVYIVQTGDTSLDLDVTSSISLNDGTIKRTSTTATTDAALNMVSAPNNLASNNGIVIDSSTVTVDSALGVTSAKPDGTYFPGETIDITLPFTKPVAVSGLPKLYLETGSQDRAADYQTGSGTKVLTFRYTVMPYDTHQSNTFLNYLNDAALDLNGGQIQRYVSQGKPSADAVISLAGTTAAGKDLKSNNQIKIDGSQSTVTSILFSTADGTYSRGSTVDIVVTFSDAVQVDISGGKPYILLDTGSVQRQALYASGSGTSQCTFQYTVRLADSSADLDYTSRAALNLNGATIRKLSSASTMDVDLTLPTPSKAMSAGNMVIDPTAGYSTTVQSLATTASTPAGEYGLNHVFEIEVEYSDEVVVTGSPKLSLSVGKNALLLSGSGTSKLKFVYTVENGDTTTSLDKASDTPIICSDPCFIRNRNGVVVSTSFTGITLSPVNIAINTDSPSVASVQSKTVASTINGNSFVVGDQIDIVITMTKEVFVNPTPENSPDKVPLLYLETGSTDRTAKFLEYDGGDRKLLVFRYIVQEGDTSEDLSYTSTSALTLNYGQATIRRFSTNPTTDAILTLPTVQPVGKATGNTLRINASSPPSVLSVTSTTTDGTYFAGDKIDVVIAFSSHVQVAGTPKLWLSFENEDRMANYVSGSLSESLVFEYTIQNGDFTLDLSYVDRNSLILPSGAMIYHRSDNPTTAAVLTLPFCGATGSLNERKQIVVDGRQPQVSSIKITNLDGTYTMGSTIDLEVTFSTSVTVDSSKGTPFILLETGVVDRKAVYVGGSPGTTMKFTYTVETGDTSSDLDYVGTGSLDSNGATILTTTTKGTATQIASLHLNPPGGKLIGTMEETFSAGKIRFRDLLVDTLGYGYILTFSTTLGGGIFTNTQFDVSYSSEFEIRPTTTASGNRFGWSVDISGDTVVLGATGEKKVHSEIQTITATGSSGSIVNEVQMLQTTAKHREEVQKIVTSASPGETVEGFFRLSLGSIGPTRKIYATADPVQIQVALELDLGLHLGGIKVSRSKNTFCACTDAFEWTITFIAREGDIPPLVAQSSLSGGGSTVGDGKGSNTAITLVDSPVISGSFFLKYGSLTTAALSHEITAEDLRTRIQADLKLDVAHSWRSQKDLQRGYIWHITFKSNSTLYDVEPLQPVSTSLLGNQAQAEIQTIQDGKAPITGSFRLKFRESMFHDETVDISVTCTEAEMATALKGLKAIEEVTVTKSSQNQFGGYTWTVTFDEINTMSSYGIIRDSMGNLNPFTPITVDSNGVKTLYGTDAEINVRYAISDSPADGLQIGDEGCNTGAAYVFQRLGDQWFQQPGGRLTDSDLETEFLFGYSVAIHGDRIVVGSPSGVSEVLGVSNAHRCPLGIYAIGLK